MDWKKCPYWLKGGIISVSILLLIYLFISFIKIIMNGGKCSADFFPAPSASLRYCFSGLVIGLIALIPLTLLRLIFIWNKELMNSFFEMGTFWLTVISLVFWFLLGALIGFLYGRIKEKNKV
jgi:hypothetical protein